MAQAKTAIAAPTSRRNFIKSSAAALAVASASPALAFPALGQDAELVELGRQLAIIDIQYREASEASLRIHEAMENQYPALPEVLKARETDKRFNLPKPNDGKWYRPVNGGSISEPGLHHLPPQRAKAVQAVSTQGNPDQGISPGNVWP
jgi:hypothetical protein